MIREVALVSLNVSLKRKPVKEITIRQSSSEFDTSF